VAMTFLISRAAAAGKLGAAPGESVLATSRPV
jgi:hypothetical protein